uniref:Uncharacterized protein n=1 Tax=Anser cygnoides TaxID=8845 RepID=A0A8B9EJ37_ANSCY
ITNTIFSHLLVSLYLWFRLQLLTDRNKSYTGPCGGRDCSTGCKCFPEKGARVSLFSLIQQFLVSLTNLGGGGGRRGA